MGNGIALIYNSHINLHIVLEAGSFIASTETYTDIIYMESISNSIFENFKISFYLCMQLTDHNLIDIYLIGVNGFVF